MAGGKPGIEPIVIRNARGIQATLMVVSKPISDQLDFAREGAEVIPEVMVQADMRPLTSEKVILIEGEQLRQTSGVPTEESLMGQLRRRLEERLRCNITVEKVTADGAAFLRQHGIETFRVTASGANNADRFAVSVKQELRAIAKDLAPPPLPGHEQFN